MQDSLDIFQMMFLFCRFALLNKHPKNITMAFDIEMIKKVYSQMAERVDKARELKGGLLHLQRKYYIPTYGMVILLPSLNVE